jgi:dienelactone hydrolase
MAEKKVPYALDGRQFEGMIVYDDGVKAKRPVVFMQPDWKGVCPDTIGQARAVAGKDYVVLMADMFGAGYGARPKTQDELRAGMLAVHKDLPFTLACGGKAHDTLLPKRGNSASPMAQKSRRSAIARAAATHSNRRAPAPISRRSSCSTSPIPTRWLPARRATSRAACSPSTARPIR